MLGRLLVVEDDRELRAMLALDLRGRGIDVEAAESAEDAFSALSARPFDAVLTDIRMPGMGGIALCERVTTNFPDVPVIVLTSFGSLETAVAAIRAGAFDFVSKPVEFEVLAIAVGRALKHHALTEHVKRLELAARSTESFGDLLGESRAMKDLARQIEACASTDVSVLVSGESGTGKELVARTLHALSARAAHPFCAVNCGAVPDALLESELFGHTRGAFTDAHRDRKGLLLQADRGTLFLDEIGDCSPAFQVKLLRVLEERRVRPVGSDKDVPFDVRLVTATHRDLESCVEDGTFREDLYFRIHVVQLRLPPLRDRGGDVLLLAHRFIEQLAARMNKPVRGLSRAAASRLLDYAWPGNVRELHNAIERAIALAQAESILVEDLPERIRAYASDRIVLSSNDPLELVPLAHVERRYVMNVLRACAGNKTQAARILGLDRKTLYRKLEGWGAAPDSDSEKPDAPP